MFVNRIPELGIFDDSLDALLKQEERFRASILDFYGVKGIGKTALLKRITEKLLENNIKYLEVNFDSNVSVFYDRMYDELKKYVPIQPLDVTQQDIYERSMAKIKELLGQGPLVLLLDSIDATNESRIEDLEEMLGQLVVYQTLLVVLASQRRVTFYNRRSVKQKLKTYAVEPLDEQSSSIYLKQLDTSLSAEQYKLIFDWTGGYLLAMNEMVSALHDGISPAEEQGRKQLTQRIVDGVVTQGLLASVEADEQEWYLTMLNLLAVPRHFSLIVWQKLIEHFEPEYKLATSLAYLVLPRKMSLATGVLGWDMAKADFAIDKPIRHILLLNLKINQYDFYLRLHQYLAQLNWQSATEAREHERILYQREYLYHSACSLDTQQLEGILTEISAKEGRERVLQLYEELGQDVEFRNAIGQDFARLLAVIGRMAASEG